MASRYQTVGVLADGGMAEICVANRVEDGLAVALKRIKRPYDQDPEFVSMFEDEGRLWARLRHPNVVRLLDAGEDDEGHYIAMELVDGLDVAEILARRGGTHLPLGFALSVATALFDALDCLHTLEDEEGAPLGLVHRDVSPGNVLCGGDGKVKLTDFGVVQAPVKTHKTRVGDLKGKFAYMSPEQTRGEALTARSDLFAAGVVLWELLAGRSLFDRATDLDTAQAVRDADIASLAELREDVSTELDACVRELLQRDPQARPASAEGVARRLRGLARKTGLAIGASSVAEIVAPFVEEVGHIGDRAVSPVRRRTRVAPKPEAGRQAGRQRSIALALGGVALVAGVALAAGFLSRAGDGSGVGAADATATPSGLVAAVFDGGGGDSGQRDSDVGVESAGRDATPPESRDAGIRDRTRRKGHDAQRRPRPQPKPRPTGGKNGGRVESQGYGTLDLSSDPWAEVAIDGVALGRHTPLRNFPVAAGRHRVTLHNPVFEITKTIVIDVKPGVRIRRVIDLTQR